MHCPVRFAFALSVLTAGCARPTTNEPVSADSAAPPAGVEAWSRHADVDPETPGPWVGLCDPASPAFAEAERALEALEQRIEKAKPTQKVGAINEAANELLTHECWALADEDAPMFHFDFEFGVELSAFWEAGGDVWMRQYLALTKPAGEDIWLLPTPRKAWTRQTHPRDPLARFLCSAELNDDPCAMTVASWHDRASRYFELWTTNPKEHEPDCLEVATKGPPRLAYAQWRECEAEQAGRNTVLPLGGLGVVDEGWLVVRGRRGHYSFCDGIAAYDLETGSAYRIESCSGLALTEGGGVDHRQTDAGRKVKVTAGTIPVALLREAAWATFSAPFAQDDVVHESTEGRPVPEGMMIGRYDSSTISGMGMSFSFSSGHTTLDWQWVDGVDAVPLTGALSWPSDLNDAAGDHAVRLLQFAEDAMTEGCASAKLPAWLADGLDLGGVSGLDADDESLRETGEALRDAMVDAAARGRCPKGG